MSRRRRDPTATLARRITWECSRQSYFTALTLADRDLVDDCFRAYAYFRWADDVVDDPSTSSAEGAAFVRRQRALIEGLYRGERPADLSRHEAIIADLIRNDRGENSGLRSYIENFLAIVEFDARRKGRLVSQDELLCYSRRLAVAVTDAILYFIQNGHPYPESDDRYAAATGAHITHMLRDMRVDLAAGLVNVPAEYLERHNLDPEDVASPAFRDWVRAQVVTAREKFRRGKDCINQLESLRCKLAARCYCDRFEVVLHMIERENYTLRASYDGRRSLSGWLRMAWVGVRVAIQHFASKTFRRGRRRKRRFERPHRFPVNIPDHES